MGIDKELLDILVCPKCKGDLELSEGEDSLICKPCSLKYPIKEDIPIKYFLAHYCGCTIFVRGRIEASEVTNLKNLWKNADQFMAPSSFLYDRSIMFTKKLSF